jgi:hypothetical protein
MKKVRTMVDNVFIRLESHSEELEIVGVCLVAALIFMLPHLISMILG